MPNAPPPPWRSWLPTLLMPPPPLSAKLKLIVAGAAPGFWNWTFVIVPQKNSMPNEDGGRVIEVAGPEGRCTSIGSTTDVLQVATPVGVIELIAVPFAQFCATPP